MEGSGRDVSLAIPAKPEYLVLVRLALSAVCRLTALSADEVADLKLAVTEAATGRVAPDEPGGDEAPELRVQMGLEEKRLVVELSGGTEASIPDEERELSRAIIDATVDEFIDEDPVRLVKYLDAAA
jgi:serine/threonine-protein kinase RsbW